jgi:hypothetical protein
MNVRIYIDTSKQVGAVDHLVVFEDKAAADNWFRTNDHREGAVARRYPVQGAVNSAEDEIAWPKKLWIYVDTSKDVGDPAYLIVFGNGAAADAWFKKHDPEGVAFKYRVIERPHEPV